MSEPTVYDVTYSSVDVETTGLDDDDEVVEVAVVKFDLHDGPLERWTQLVRPEGKIPPEATNIHGITEAMVRNAPNFDWVQERVERFADGTVLIAHNASFDLKFFDRLGNEHAVVDTLKLARRHLSNDGYSLGELVEVENWHRALPDALAGIKVYRSVIEALESERTDPVMLSEVTS